MPDPIASPSPAIRLLLDSQARVYTAAVQRVAQALRSPDACLPIPEDTTRTALRTLQLARQLGTAHVDALEARFGAALADRRGALAASVAPRERPTTLALLAEDALDADIAVGKLVRKTISELDGDALAALDMRVGELRGSAPVDTESNPLGPRAVLLALYEATAAASPEAEVRIALASLLQPHITLALRETYEITNEALVAAGVMPEVVYRVQKSAEERPPGAGRLGLTQSMSLAELLPTLHALPNVLELQRLLRALAAREAAAPPLAARILTDTRNAYHSAALEAPIDPQTLAALAAVQRLRDEASAADGDPLARVKAAARGDLDPLDQLTGQLVAVVLDYVLRDPALPPYAKTQIARLQIVGFRAALLDRTFFARREHPFRRLLDRLAELAADPAHASADGPFAQTLVRIVDGLVTDFQDDLAIFDASLEELDATLEFAAAGDPAALQAAIAALPELETLAVMRDRAHAAVDALLRDAPPGTPAWVAEALATTWVDVLVATWRTHGGQALWDERVAIAERLLWSLKRHPREAIAEVSRALPAIVGGVRGAMESTGIDSAVRGALLERLFEAHQALIRQARAAESPAPASDALPFSAGPRPPALPASPVSTLRAGLDIVLDVHSDPQRARIVEVGAAQRLCVLALASGEARHMRCEELEREIAMGNVRLESHIAGVVERALADLAESRPTTREDAAS